LDWLAAKFMGESTKNVNVARRDAPCGCPPPSLTGHGRGGAGTHKGRPYEQPAYPSHAWCIKALHRLILLSSTYQQSSDDRADAKRIDPENRLLWKMNRQRLDFEALRDSLLAAS